MNVVKVLAPAMCYFLFNWEFFRCVESVLPVKPLDKWKMTWTFLLNYGIFYLSAVFSFHLIINWIIFLGLLFAEQIILYKLSLHKCLFTSLLGTLFGLAANIFFRSLTAIIMNVPLVAFDNRVLETGNMKAFPVLMGFLSAGMVFLLTARLGALKKLVMVVDNKGMSVFLSGLLTAMYFYLCMNLFVYYISDNNLILKLWSMKSAVFVIMGEYLAVLLSIRMAEMSAYRAKSQESREQLAAERAREAQLLSIAATDPLTGCENRRQAEKRIQDAMQHKDSFCLGFVDLNGLKSVNDNLGHEMGDEYILSVVRVLRDVCRQEDFLFRYGGDEFLLLFFNADQKAAEQSLLQAQKKLEAICQDYPFLMSFCYGIASQEDGDTVMEIIHAADDRMYLMKTSMKV